MLLRSLQRAQVHTQLRKCRPSLSVLVPGLSHRRAFHIRTLLGQSSKKSDDDGIRIFNQTLGPNDKKLYIEPDENLPLEDLEAQLKDAIAKLKKEEARENRNFDPLPGLSADQKKTLIEGLEALKLEEDQKLRIAEERASRLPGHKEKGPAFLKIPVLRRLRPFLDNFNKYLVEAQSPDATVRTRKELWRWYTRSKQNLPPFLFLVPMSVWHVLWNSMSGASLSNPDRWAHIRTLAEDVIAAGHELSPQQKVNYIESLHETGAKDKAIEIWGNEVVVVGMDMKVFQGFWVLGVRMFSEQGDPERAEKTAHMLLGSKGKKDYRILLPVIQAWIDKGGPKGYNKAWGIYLQLKEKLGSTITMDDYDRISTAFLKSGKRDLGLAVFKDMMLTGDPNASDSLVLYKKAMAIVGNIQSLSLDVSDAEKVSMELMTALPQKFQNKFFYGSWMKKLIGMGEIDAAASVADLMWEKNLQPAPKYINGIIAAWLRTSDAANQKKAEDMAWNMIKERLNFVRARRTESEVSVSLSIPSAQDKSPKFPCASAETFCVLLDFYAEQGRHEMAEKLQEFLSRCEYNPTPEFMNHFLYSAIRHGGITEVWDRYKEFTLTSGQWRAQPNMLTFQSLWDCMAMKLDPTRARADGDFPVDCRQLFAEMVEWWQAIRRKSPKQRKHFMTRRLYNDIVRCFVTGESEDYLGCVVALNCMPALFGIYPDESTAQTVLEKIAQAEDREDEARRLSQPSRLPVTRQARARAIQSRRERRAKLSEASRAFAEIEASRVSYLNSTMTHELSEEEQSKEKLFVLSEFLRVVIGQMLEDPAQVESEIKKAAWEMEVPSIELPT
ncbi:MAG: hypothetical protein M1814_000163 [Vezdaea aestivalis]|nr:MAG: hypothetical protein M1814_000163 [Vezdaea aestivalis]